MPFKTLVTLSLGSLLLLLACGKPSAPAGGGNIPTTKMEQGDAVLLRKNKKGTAYSDTTLILLDTANNIRVNDVIFQGPDFGRLIVNQWESRYLADTVLPVAFRVQFDREVYMGQRGSIYDAIRRAQDTVRMFIMKREGVDSAQAVSRYPVLGQRISW